MTNMRKTITTAVATMTVAFIPVGIAYGAGSGGGGGGGASSSSSGGTSISPSAPQFDPAVEYRKGLEALNEKNYKAADRAFGKVLKVSRKHPETHYYRGLARAALGKHKQAAKSFKTALRYKGDMFEAMGAMGTSYALSDKTEKAQDTLEHLKVELAECGDCANSTRIQTAIAQVEKAIAGDEATKVSFLSPFDASASETQYFAAVSLINQGKYELAFNDLTLTSAVAGPHPDVLTYMGYTQRKLGNYNVAKDYYAQALEVAPNHKGANEYLGELYVETGEMDMANVQLAKLETICQFGCIEEDELRGWIVNALP